MTSQTNINDEVVFEPDIPYKVDFDVPYIPEIDEFKDDPFIFE